MKNQSTTPPLSGLPARVFPFHRLPALTAIVGLLLGSTAWLPAQTIWTNGNTTAQSGLLNWGDTNNWVPNVVPNAIDSVVIFTNSPNLTINNGQTFTNGTLSATNAGNAWIIKYGTGTNYLQVSSGIPVLNVSVSGVTAWFQGAYVAGTQGFLKSGLGKVTWRYNGNSNIGLSGPIIVGAGTLGFSLDGNFGNASSLTLSNGTTLVLENGTSGAFTTSLSPARTFSLASATTAVTLAVNTLQTMVVPGVITELNPGSMLNFTGGGTLVLSNANTFTGPMTMTGGTNDLASQNAVQYSTLTVNGGLLTFDQAVTGNAFTFGGLAGTAAGNNVALQNNAATPAAITLTVGGNNAGTSFAGNLTGLGSLVKTGTGSLGCAGTNSYAGTTTIQQGRLIVPAVSTGNGAYSVSDGATNRVKLAALGQTLTNSSLTLGVSTGATMEFDNTNLANPSVAMVKVTNLTLNGTTKVNIYGTTFSVGTINLLAYTAKTGSGTWSLNSLPTGVIGTLNDTGSILQLNVTAAPNSALFWRGNVGSVWDTNNIANNNWYGLPSGGAAYYTENYGTPSVTFDDTATGSTAITLGVKVSPASLNITNSALNYSITGAGIIGSSVGLIKNGTGSFTLGVSNNFTGATINGGTLGLTGANNVLPVADTVTFNTNGVLNLGGNNQTLASIAMASPSVVYKNSPTSTISNGVLTVSGAGNFSPATTNLTATMDLSGLSGAYFTNASQAFSLNMNNPTANGTAILNLATNGTGTNFIAATAMNLGTAGFAAAGGATDLLNLGPWNTIWVNTWTMGSYRAQLETVGFQPGLTASNLTVMGTGGTNRVASMSIGENNSGSAYDTANFIVGAGTFNCSVSNLTMGIQNINNTTAGRIAATLDLGAAGNFDCLTLTNGQGLGNASTYMGADWISQHGGNAHFKNMIMGDSASTVANCNLQSAYFLNGGTLFAQNIQPGNDGAGVSAASFRGINWTNGTIRNYTSTNALTISPNSYGSMVTISAPGSGSRFFVVDSGLTNTINGTITQINATNTPIVMSGPGTLDLQGTTSNYFLGLNVSNGVALLDKQNAEAIGSGLTLNGGSAILAANGGSGGDQIADAGIVTINSGTFDLNGQTETIGGLAGAGGTLADASGGSATLTVNVASGANYTNASAINHGNLVIGLATGGGQGTQIFAGTDARSTSGSETTVINSGTLQIGNGGTGGSLAGSGITINSPGFLAFANSGTLNFAGSISGNGSVAQNGSGSLTLSGSVSYTGNTLVNAGTLMVASGGTTLGGSPSTIAVASNATLNVTGGAGNFQVQGQQTLNGSGSVIGSYQVSSGATNSGNLTVNGNVTLFDGSVLNPGGYYTAGTITVNGNVTVASGNPQLIYTLTGATTPGGGTNSLLAVSGVLDTSAGSPILVIQGVPHAGTYTLATFGSFNGPGGPTDTSNIQVPVSGTFTFTPVINGNTLQLVVVGNPKNLVWQGDGSANTWDANNSGNTDWSNTVTHVMDYFSTVDNVVFNDSSANPVVNLTADLLPGTLTVNAAINNYTFANSGGYIDGPVALTKTNAGMLTIQTANTFTGPVNINGGVVSVDTVAPAGAAQPLGEGNNLNLNGGALQYTGSPVPVGQFSSSITLGSKGGAIDQESSGGIYFFVTNTISGSGKLTKLGPQQLILGDVPSNTGSNSYAGGTVVTNGNLQLRNAAALGTNAVWIYPGASLTEDGGFTGLIMNNVFLEGGSLGGGPAGYNFGGTVTLVTNSSVGVNNLTLSGQITGPSLLNVTAGTVTLLNNTNNYAGGTVVTAGTLQLGTNGTSGWIAAQPASLAITNNGTINFNRADTNAILASITGTGSLVQNGSGTTILGGSNSFTGNVTINGTAAGGALLVTNSSALGNGVVAINGGVNNGFLQLAGNLAINNNFTLGQKDTPNGGVGAQPPHVSNASGTNAILGAMTVGAGGNYWALNSASGLLAIAAVNNTAGGFLRPLYLEGAGNGVITNLTDATQLYLQINKQGAGVWTLAGAASLGAGLVVNQGTLIVAGTVDNATNTVNTTVNGGALIVNGALPGPVTVANLGLLGGAGIITNSVIVQPGGTLAPSAYNSTLTTLLTLNSNLTLSGSLFFNLNQTNVLTSDEVVVNGSMLTNTAAGTLTVTNFGPALTNGDTFTLFSQAVSNGAALTVVGGGTSVTWTNNLALNGTITVLSVTPPVTVNTNPATANFQAVAAGGGLYLSWAPDHKGWQLYSNSVGLNAASSWFPIPGSASETNTTIIASPAKANVFFQLRYP